MKIVIYTPIPTLNQIIGNAAGRNGRYSPHAVNKRAVEAKIVGEICAQVDAGAKVSPASHFHFKWECKDRRRDPDNIAGGGQKMVLDALQKAGVLEGDGWEYVKFITHEFYALNNAKLKPRVILTITDTYYEWNTSKLREDTK